MPLFGPDCIAGGHFMMVEQLRVKFLVFFKNCVKVAASLTFFHYALFIIIVILFRNYFLSDSPPVGSDIFNFIQRTSCISHNKVFFTSWWDISQNTGSTVPILLINFLGIGNYFIRDSTLLIKLFLIVMTGGAAITMYIFLKNLTGNRIAASTGGLFYILNPSFHAYVAAGHLNHLMFLFLLPLSLQYLKISLNSPNRNNIIKFILITSIMALTRFDTLFYLFLIFSIVLILNLLFGFWSKDIKSTLKVLVVALSIGLILTAFSWIPIIKIGTSLLRATINTLHQYDYAVSIYRALTLQNIPPDALGYLYWTSTNPQLYFGIPLEFYQIIWIIIPFLVFSTLLIRPQSKIIISFSLISLVSILLSTGMKAPFSEAYGYLFNKLPLLTRIKPFRWGLLTIFSYSVILSYLVDHIIKKYISSSKFRHNNLHFRKLEFTMPILTIVVLVLNTPAVFIEGYKVQRISPESEVKPHLYIKYHGGQDTFRVTTVPIAQRRMFNHGGILVDDLGSQSYGYHGKPVFFSTGGYYSYPMIEYLNNLRKKDANVFLKIVGVFNVRYFVFQGYPHSRPGKDWGTYASHISLEDNSGLELVYIGDLNNYTIKAEKRYPNIIEMDDFERNENDFYSLIKPKRPEMENITVERNPKVYLNKYYRGRLFIPDSQTLVIGGIGLTSKLIPEGNSSSTNLLFAHQIRDKQGIDSLRNAAVNSDQIVLTEETDRSDLIILLSKVQFVNFSESLGWEHILTTSLTPEYYLGEDLYQSKKEGSILRGEVGLPENNIYEIWIRTDSINRNSFEFSVDEENGEKFIVKKESSYGRFNWVKISTMGLDVGVHTIKVTALDDLNNIDEIVFISVHNRKQTEKFIDSIIQHKIIHIQKKSENLNITNWKNPNPQSVDVRKSEMNLTIDANRPRKIAAFITNSFPSSKDWSEYDQLNFLFKGRGTKKTFNIYIAFNNTKPAKGDWVVYSFRDTSKEWRNIDIDLSNPSRAHGNPNWTKVSFLAIDSPNKSIIGEFTISNISLMGLSKINLPNHDEPKANIVSTKKLSPTKYMLKIRSSTGYPLVFSNTYHPMWKANISGKQLNPIPSYYHINSYWINERGEHEVIIEFTGQRIQNISLIVSGLAYFGCFGYLFYDWRKRKRYCQNKMKSK